MDTLVSAKVALLQALIRADGYGLDLIERVKTQTGGRIVLGQGSIYPALREMEREGLISSYEGDPMPERGGRPRRYYQIEAEGKRVAQEHREVVCELFLLRPVRM